MYPHNYFCTLPVFDEQHFLETDLYEFILSIANEAFRTIGIKAHINQCEECVHISNIFKSVSWNLLNWNERREVAYKDAKSSICKWKIESYFNIISLAYILIFLFYKIVIYSIIYKKMLSIFVHVTFDPITIGDHRCTRIDWMKHKMLFLYKGDTPRFMVLIRHQSTTM